MRVPAIVLATHEREARHTFARARNGFARFAGIMDKIPIPRIRNLFSCHARAGKARARYCGKAGQAGFLAATRRGWWALLKNLLEKGLIKMGKEQGCRNSPVAAGLDQAAVQGFSEPPWQAAD